jgi:Domain of unknown function (DUF5004)
MSTSRPHSSSALRFIFFGCVIFLVSCQDSENINPLSGSWTLKSVISQNCKDESQNFSITYPCENSNCSKYTFSEDGTLRIERLTGGGTKVVEGTYTIATGTVVTNIADGENPITRTFTFDLSEPHYLYLIEVFPRGSGKCSPTTVLKK